MELDDITYKVRGAIFSVFKELGPGLLEKAYVDILAYELRNLGLNVRKQVGVPVIYKGKQFKLGFHIDLLVEEQVVVEVKSVSELQPVHKKHLLTYLKLSGNKIGILVNFNAVHLDKSNLVRIVN